MSSSDSEGRDETVIAVGASAVSRFPPSAASAAAVVSYFAASTGSSLYAMNVCCSDITKASMNFSNACGPFLGRLKITNFWAIPFFVSCWNTKQRSNHQIQICYDNECENQSCVPELNFCCPRKWQNFLLNSVYDIFFLLFTESFWQLFRFNLITQHGATIEWSTVYYWTETVYCWSRDSFLTNEDSTLLLMR